MWVLAALSMTVGNVLALRQTQHRPHARLLEHQPGRLHPHAARRRRHERRRRGRRCAPSSCTSSSTRPRTSARSRWSSPWRARPAAARSRSYGGLFSYAPGLGVLMTIFLASLAGIPPLGGWFAKFGAFQAVLDAGDGWGYSIAVIAAVNTVIAAAYYITVMREIWMKPVPDGDVTPIRTPGVDPGGAGHHVRRHDRVRRAARPGQPLRRPHRPHRCLRRLTTSRRPIAAAAGPLRFDEFMQLALVRRSTASTHVAADGPAGAATSSRRPRSGRCSAPCSPRARRAGGDELGDPTTSRSSRSAPGRARWPGRSSPPRRRARALRYVAVEVVAAQRALHPDGVESLRRAARPADPGVVVANELLDNLPFRLPCSTAAGARRTSTSAATAARRGARRRRSTRCRRGCRRRRRTAPGCRGRSRPPTWVDAARASLERGRVAGRSTTSRRAPPSWRRGRGGSGCARTAATSAAATTSPTPGAQDITAQVALDQLPDARRGAARRPQFLQRWGIDELVEEGRASGRPPRPRPTVRRADDAQPGPRGRGAARSGRLGGFLVSGVVPLTVGADRVSSSTPAVTSRGCRRRGDAASSSDRRRPIERRRRRASSTAPRPARRHGARPPGRRSGMGALALGALGVVFGDIGTSPLYAFRESFEHQDLRSTEANVLGLRRSRSGR